MGLYRCAACGSPNVMIDTQAGGIKYNYLKGAVGTVLLGVGGAAAGIGSQQQTVYKCPDCGMVLTYPMSEALADLIDIGVMYPKARSQLKLMNVDVPWEFIEKKYKNIDPEGQEKRRIEQEEKAKREQQRLAAEKSYGLFHHAESGLTFDHFNQCRILVRSGIACLFQRGLGSNDSVVGEIISKQILHSKTFLMLLASCVFFRSPPLILK